MEQVIVSIAGLILVVVLYQERGRRADMASLRAEIKELRAEIMEEMSRRFARVDRRFDTLTASVIDLAERVGQVKGRTEVLTTAD